MKWINFTINNFDKILYLKNKFNKFTVPLLINYMKDEKKLINQLQNIDFKIEEIKLPLDQLKSYSSSYFVNTDGVLNDLNNLIIEVKISFGNNNIYLKCTKDKFESIKKRLPIFLKMIVYLKKTKELNIYLILTKLKKQYFNSKEIGANHVNSGYTDFNKNIIFIWREEEFEKVTFHELMHILDKDHRNENFDIDISYEIKEDMHRYYEALTDCKAICYNIIYLSILTNLKISSILKYEIYFMNNQALYMQSILNQGIKQNSSVYAYYILKAKLFNYLSNIDQFEFEDIFIHSKNGNTLLNKIYNNEFLLKKHVDFNSCRMTFFELY
jgi:hypothetical protein